MILSSIPTLLKINLSHLELFLLNNLSRLLKIRGLKYNYVLLEFKTYRIVYFPLRLFAKHQTLSSRVGFLVAGLDCAKFVFYQFPIFLFIVVIVISILVKTTF